MAMGPINREISMAPMMVAGEFTFSPTEALMMANINTHIFVPLACPAERTAALIASVVARSLLRSNSLEIVEGFVAVFSRP